MVLKKLICTIVSIIVVFNTVLSTPSVKAADGGELNCYEILTALGISRIPTEEICTRAEFVVLVLDAMGMYNAVAPAIQAEAFSDVPDVHWASKGLQMAYYLNLIKGNPDGTINPDGPITLNEAVKILVSALGYRTVAEQGGGYPIGYIKVAQSNRLLSGIDAPEFISGEQAAQLVFNALEAPALRVTGFYDSNNIKIDSTAKNTFLGTYADTYKAYGTVDANVFTGLKAPEGKTQSGKVSINGTVYESGTSGVENMLGQRVRFYYTDNRNGEPRVIFAIPERTTVLEIKGADLVSLDGRTYTYLNENGKDAKAEFDKTAYVIYNGIAYDGYLRDDLFPPRLSQVELTLIDNDDDGIYDVVFLWEYDGFVLNFNDNDQKLYDVLGRSPVTVDKDEVILRIIRGGAEADLSALSKNDALLVAQSKNTVGKKLVTILADSETLSGVIGETQMSKSEEWVIGGTKYALSEDYTDAVNRYKEFLALGTGAANHPGFSLDLMNIGDGGSFYIDAFGNIAYAVRSASASRGVGYLLSTRTQGGVSGKLCLKVFTENNVFEELWLADRVICDGVRITEHAAIKSVLSTPQIIRYELNGNGEINWLDTSAVTNPGEDDDALRAEMPAARYRYKRQTRSFGGVFSAANDALVFIVPLDSTMVEEQYFESGNVGYFQNDEEYDLIPYNFDDRISSNLFLVIADKRDVRLANETPLMVIGSLSKALDRDGGEITLIKGLSMGGTEFSSYLSDTTTIIDRTNSGAQISRDDLQRGDAIRIKTDRNNNIQYVERMANAQKVKDKLTTAFYSAGGWADNFHAAGGMMYDKNDSLFLLASLSTDMTAVNTPRQMIDAGIKVYSYATPTVIEYDMKNDLASFIQGESIIGYKSGVAQGGLGWLYIIQTGGQTRCIVWYRF